MKKPHNIAQLSVFSFCAALFATAAFAEGTLYVKVGGDDSASGLDWDNALATPQVAVDKLGADGGTVYLAAGEFGGAQPILNLTTPVTVVGEGMGKTILKPNNSRIRSLGCSCKVPSAPAPRKTPPPLERPLAQMERPKD